MNERTLLAMLLLCVTACTGPDRTAQTATEPAEAHAETAEATELGAVPQVITEEIYPRPEQQPNFGPKYGSITFVDTDPGPTIGGTLTMGRAVDASGALLNEADEGITTYMVHWGLEVGAPGTADDAGAGDHGGDCRGFRDTGHVVMRRAADIGDADTLSWDIPAGTPVPEGAVYFVGHTLYGDIHNLAKCTQTPIDNRIQ